MSKAAASCTRTRRKLQWDGPLSIVAMDAEIMTASRSCYASDGNISTVWYVPR